jgi:uncharacterized protein
MAPNKLNRVALYFLVICGATLLLVSSPYRAWAQFTPTWDFLDAMKDRDYQEMRDKIGKGANLNAYDDDGFSAVTLAADWADLRLLRFVIEQGAYVDHATKGRRETAFMRRAEVNDLETVTLLLELGANIDAQDRGGATALMKASRGRYTRVVRFLIEKGADVNLSDFTGRSALAYAREARASRIIRMLEQAGAF